MEVKFNNNESQVMIEISPETETEEVALRMFCQLNGSIDETNICINTSIEEPEESEV